MQPAFPVGFQSVILIDRKASADCAGLGYSPLPMFYSYELRFLEVGTSEPCVLIH